MKNTIVKKKLSDFISTIDIIWIEKIHIVDIQNRFKSHIFKHKKKKHSFIYETLTLTLAT